MTLFILLAAQLYSPRGQEQWGNSTPMLKPPPLPMVIVAGMAATPTNYWFGFVWDLNRDADDYVTSWWFEGSSLTNYSTNTAPPVPFSVDDSSPRVIGRVIARNDVGDSDPSYTQNPPWPPDRIIITPQTNSAVAIQQSSNLKQWNFFTNASGPFTVLCDRPAQFFRSSVKLTITGWNPLNQ
jgi:hypothetical protein